MYDPRDPSKVGVLSILCPQGRRLTVDSQKVMLVSCWKSLSAHLRARGAALWGNGDEVFRVRKSFACEFI